MKKAIQKIQTLMGQSAMMFQNAKTKLKEENGQFVIDNGVVFVIIIVIAAIVITVLTNYIENDFNDLIINQINAFFNP